MVPEARLTSLGLTLPDTRMPVGSYVSAATVGDLVFVSGHASFAGGGYITGTLGRDLDVDGGREAAARAALGVLASLKAEIGELTRVRRIVKVLGLVRSTPEFTQHPAVVDGCSDLLVAVFGDRGRHARSAVGVASLPFGAAVEIELVVAIEPRSQRRGEPLADDGPRG